jgi:CheY-like chemotaxis protein
MKPADYHSILAALDQALDVFNRADGEQSEDDRELLQRLAIIRSQVLKADSGDPFPLRPHPDLVWKSSPPTSDDPPQFHLPSGSAPPLSKRIRVLIADDHDTVRKIVRTLLAIEGDFEVVAEAVNGREAVDLAKLYRPEVIVMDMTMPTLDGVSATREVLQILPETKVIIFSANQDPAASRASFAAGAAGFINKPTSRKVLVAALRDAVQVKPATVSS